MFTAGNLINKLSVHLQPRLVSLSWLRRGGVRCFSHNADDSALPARYIPKKRRDANHTERCTSEDISPKDGMPTKSNSSVIGSKGLDDAKSVRRSSVGGKGSNVSIQAERGSWSPKVGMRVKSNSGVIGNKGLDGTKSTRRNSAGGKPSNVSLHADYELYQGAIRGISFPDPEHVQASQEVVDYLKVPQEVVEQLQVHKRRSQSQKMCYQNGLEDSQYVEVPDEAVEEAHISDRGDNYQQDRPKPCRIRQGAEKLAVGLLAKRAYTVLELRMKLTTKDFPLNIVESVVRDFQNRGLINDGLYAETFSQSRWTSSSWGPRRIKQALMKKGVSEADVQNAVKLVFENSEDGDQRSSLRLSNSSLQRLYEQASKQWLRSQNVPHDTRKARVIRWLQYRGFDWGVVSTILKKLESN